MFGEKRKVDSFSVPGCTEWIWLAWPNQEIRVLFQSILLQAATLFALDESKGEHSAFAMPIPHVFSGTAAALLFKLGPARGLQSFSHAVDEVGQHAQTGLRPSRRGLSASLPVGGCVESELTRKIHRFCCLRGIESWSAGLRADCGGNGGPSRIRRAVEPYLGNYTKVCGNNTVLAASDQYLEASELANLLRLWTICGSVLHTAEWFVGLWPSN